VTLVAGHQVVISPFLNVETFIDVEQTSQSYIQSGNPGGSGLGTGVGVLRLHLRGTHSSHHLRGLPRFPVAAIALPHPSHFRPYLPEFFVRLLMAASLLDHSGGDTATMRSSQIRRRGISWWPALVI
jgi:hypothetical protein